MKKLFLSLVAVTVMSSAAFANSGEKASDNNAASSKSTVKAIKEVKFIKAGERKTICRLTVSIVNTSGQVIDTQVVTYNCYGATDMFYSNCNEFFSATIQNYQNYYGNPNHG